MPGSKMDTKRKWLPDEDADSVKFYSDCRAVYKSCKALVTNLKDILSKHTEGTDAPQDLDDKIQSMATCLDSLRRINLHATKNSFEEVENCKKNLWKNRLWIERLAISKLAYDITAQLLDSPQTESALRLAHLYNESLLLTLSHESRNMNVYSNKCPMLLYPLRKLSIMRLLQIVAKKRAENCSFMFVEGLLSNYTMPNRPASVREYVNDANADRGDEIGGNAEPNTEDGQTREEEKTPEIHTKQDSISSDTSIEIYRALTKHLTHGRDNKENCPKPLEMLLQIEEKRTRALLSVCANVAPQVIGVNCVKPSKTSGQSKVKKAVKEKLTNFYMEVLWGEVGCYVEHGLLWWTSDPLGSFPPTHSHQLRDYLITLKNADSVPQYLMPALNSLVDALCCHVTSTSWDQLFRKTLVFAGNNKSNKFSNCGIEGAIAGQLYADMLADLIQLSNSCEDPKLGLEQLPLVEQIPILHRLDHSVHTARLWTANQCRQLAAKWNLNEFYRTCHTDTSRCLEVLGKLQLADHGKIPKTTSVQVTVCAQMRAKLTSEVRENIDKLKKTSNECINVLGTACRTLCLANLHMTFPPPLYWKQSGPLPDYASEYVENYLDCILRPVFVATKDMSILIQQSSSSMILRILCESWMEYIYSHRIKFSEWGAVQLLTDFGAVPTWLMERVQLKKELLHPLVVHEVLRRCEGVGRLLLRRRGESIAMSPPLASRSTEESSADNMPAEMYVPNQEQWLELRAPLQANICCQL